MFNSFFADLFNCHVAVFVGVVCGLFFGESFNQNRLKITSRPSQTDQLEALGS